MIQSSSMVKGEMKKEGKQMRTVWDIPNNKTRIEIKFGKHPTQKPLLLMNRIITAASKVGDVCLVPFAGAGSECVSAKSLGRMFIGFEIDEKYVEITKKRLEHIDKENTQKILGDFSEK